MTTGVGPSARFSVAGDCLDPQISGVLVFIGGCNKNLEALDDMFYLHTGLVQPFLFYLKLKFLNCSGICLCDFTYPFKEHIILHCLDNLINFLILGLTSIRDERRLEKLSLRKQLKLKCQEQILNSPVNDKALVRIDTSTDFHHTVPTYAQPSKIPITALFKLI